MDIGNYGLSIGSGNPYSNPYIPASLPLWLKLLNYLNVAPVITWPVIFFSTVFFFDAPASKLEAFAAFIVVNSYPVLLLGSLASSFLLYRKGKKTLSMVIPAIVFFVNIFVLALVFEFLL